MINKIIKRLEEEREHSYADFYEYLMKYELDNDFDEDDDWFYKGLIRAIKIVQEVAKEYGNGWIPVETELPKEHGKYLVTVENLTGRDILPEKVFECAYMYGQFIFNGSFDNRVTAWRKKPAPYQKGE